MGKRRTYTSEFKIEAVKLVTEQGRSFAEAATSLGIAEGSLASGSKSSIPMVVRPSPATVIYLPSRRNCGACGPRTASCGWNATF